MTYRPLSQGEVEEALQREMDRYEAETDRYRDLAEKAAEAHAEYRLSFHADVLRLAAAKMTAQQREAQATLNCAALYRSDKVLAARVDATAKALWMIQTRVEGYRTLSANVRSQT